MKPFVCLVGAKGNMGRRYKSILNHLGVKWYGVDVGYIWPPEVSHYIIATPTETHLEMISQIKSHTARILVEKPLCQLSPMLRIQTVREACEKHKNKLYMVNQYAYTPGIDGIGPTIYDYYNTGKDGIAWDCIQLIHLATGQISLRNKSPVWQCTINGQPLTHEIVDRCYVEMIKDFLSNGQQHGKLWGWYDIEKSLERALQWETDLDRSPGEKHINSSGREVGHGYQR
jgi:hypothetical protein